MELLAEKACIIILARKGSKRLPGKNHYPVAGKPLYQYTFDFVEKLGYPVYVISDDHDLLKKACEKNFAAIEEPAHYATDTGGNMELMRWVHDQIGKDIYFMFPITSPVRDKKLMLANMKLFVDNSGISSKYSVDSKYLEDGSFYGWRKKQLERKFIYDEYSRPFVNNYSFDINDINDINEVERYLENKVNA